MVTINVGGTKFTSFVDTLSSGSSYFSRLFSGVWTTGEEIFLDRDAAPFEVLLTYLRSGLIELPEDDASLFRRTMREADFLGMDGFMSCVKARTYSNTLTHWTGTDAKAVAAFDERYGSIEEALSTGALPKRFFSRGTGDYVDGRQPREQIDAPRVLKLLPADGYDVRFEPNNGVGFAGYKEVVRTAVCLALVQRPDKPGPTMDAFVVDDIHGGTCLASLAFGHSKKWHLVKREEPRYIHLGENEALTPVFWKDKDDHSKGEHRGKPITLLRVIENSDSLDLKPKSDVDGAFETWSWTINWDSGRCAVEPLQLRLLQHDEDDSDDDFDPSDDFEVSLERQPDESFNDWQNRVKAFNRERRRRRAIRQRNRQGKLILQNVMEYTNFKEMEMPDGRKFKRRRQTSE